MWLRKARNNKHVSLPSQNVAGLNQEPWASPLPHAGRFNRELTFNFKSNDLIASEDFVAEDHTPTRPRLHASADRVSWSHSQRLLRAS